MMLTSVVTIEKHRVYTHTAHLNRGNKEKKERQKKEKRVQITISPCRKLAVMQKGDVPRKQWKTQYDYMSGMPIFFQTVL